MRAIARTAMSILSLQKTQRFYLLQRARPSLSYSRCHYRFPHPQPDIGRDAM